jgi:predicted phage-related endonuclease
MILSDHRYDPFVSGLLDSEQKMTKNTDSVNGGALSSVIPSPVRDLCRHHFIGGSDARIIMGKDNKALLRLWREKRGEEAPADLSNVLLVQLGLVTEELNRRWYEVNSGKRVSDIQRQLKHRSIPWMAATLDGLVKETGAVFEAKFMLPWAFSEAAAAEKHMAQLQHNMLVAGTRKSVLSIITGGGWIQLSVEADPIYQTILIAAEKAFWQSVKTGEPPALFDCEPPKPRIEAVRVVDMTASNSWAEFASLFCETRQAHADHERAKSELKGLMPEDAKEAIGRGIRAKRSKSGAISFDLLATEADHASLQ